MTYTHLSQPERYQIHALRSQRVSCTQIALELGRHRSSIVRELRRNSGARGYRPAQAHDKATARQGERRNARQVTSAQWCRVDACLRLGLSPQQIAGRLRLEDGPGAAKGASHEAIYQRAYRDKRAGGDLAALLRCQKVRRKRYASGQERRGQLKDRVSIEQRPAVVNEKSRIGHWEGDTVIGKAHQGVLVTLVERYSRYTLARQVNSRHSAGVTQAIIGLLRLHKAQCLTVTFDNGKEFAEHAFIGQCLGADVYFAHPYRSWERGLNENTNGLLRQYFPKSVNLRKVCQSQVDEAVYRLNHRPRKCLGYRTPPEVFLGLEIQPITLHHVALCS